MQQDLGLAGDVIEQLTRENRSLIDLWANIGASEDLSSCVTRADVVVTTEEPGMRKKRTIEEFSLQNEEILDRLPVSTGKIERGEVVSIVDFPPLPKIRTSPSLEKILDAGMMELVLTDM
jgi:hypothetical protein